jgi:hypothetical protein
VAFISIDGGTRPGSAENFLDEQGAVHHILNDAGREAFAAYRVRGIPTTCIIDHAGRLMYRHIGFREGDEKRFAAEIDALLDWMPAS